MLYVASAVTPEGYPATSHGARRRPRIDYPRGRPLRATATRHAQAKTAHPFTSPAWKSRAQPAPRPWTAPPPAVENHGRAWTIAI